MKNAGKPSFVSFSEVKAHPFVRTCPGPFEHSLFRAVFSRTSTFHPFHVALDERLTTLQVDRVVRIFPLRNIVSDRKTNPFGHSPEDSPVHLQLWDLHF